LILTFTFSKLLANNKIYIYAVDKISRFRIIYRLLQTFFLDLISTLGVHLYHIIGTLQIFYDDDDELLGLM